MECNSLRTHKLPPVKILTHQWQIQSNNNKKILVYEPVVSTTERAKRVVADTRQLLRLPINLPALNTINFTVYQTHRLSESTIFLPAKKRQFIKKHVGASVCCLSADLVSSLPKRGGLNRSTPPRPATIPWPKYASFPRHK